MGVISSAVFATRNTGKAIGGDAGRGPAAIVQAYNSIQEAARLNIKGISDKATALLDKVDDAGKIFGVSNATTKVATVASKAVNPLLCAASGIRVLKDDDQYSALVEEGLAMGTMFGVEKGFKGLKDVAKKAVDSGSLDDIVKNKTAQKWGKSAIDSIKNMTKGKRTALAIATEVLFVAASVCAFDIGKKAGKKITGRDKSGDSGGNNPFKPQSTSKQ